MKLYTNYIQTIYKLQTTNNKLQTVCNIPQSEITVSRNILFPFQQTPLRKLQVAPVNSQQLAPLHKPTSCIAKLHNFTEPRKAVRTRMWHGTQKIM